MLKAGIFFQNWMLKTGIFFQNWMLRENYAVIYNGLFLKRS